MYTVSTTRNAHEQAPLTPDHRSLLALCRLQQPERERDSQGSQRPDCIREWHNSQDVLRADCVLSKNHGQRLPECRRRSQSTRMGRAEALQRALHHHCECIGRSSLSEATELNRAHQVAAPLLWDAAHFFIFCKISFDGTSAPTNRSIESAPTEYCFEHTESREKQEPWTPRCIRSEGDEYKSLSSVHGRAHTSICPRCVNCRFL